MTYSKLKSFTAIGVGAAVASSLYYFDSNNLLFNICQEKYGNLSIQTGSKWDFNWDKRDPKSLVKHIKSSSDQDSQNKKKDVKAIRHIILVRHGQYNLDGKTDDERYLTKLGRLQAEATGLRLSELALPNASIVRSTMKRAQETSELIQSYLPNLPVKNDSLLEEGFPIYPEPPIGRYKPEKVPYQDGPRIEAAFRKYIHRADNSEQHDSHTIIVCHANVIRYFICKALQFPAEGWLRLSLNHASLTWISVLPSGRVTLRCYGESGHMLPEWITR